MSQSVLQPASPIAQPALGDAAIARIAAHCNTFRGALPIRSIGQLALNIILYAGLLAAMYGALAAGAWWVTILLALPAGGILVRLFTIQHDCGHGSFFRSKRANHAVGWFISLLTFTPYGFWRDAHNRHHASSGNLTKRGMGGVDTLTVAEFKALAPWKQKLYQFYRHPITLHVFGPPFYFLLMQRLPLAGPMPYSDTYLSMKGAKIWQSVMLLNAGLVVFYSALSFFFGGLATLIVFLPVVSIAAWAGAWLFFVQHQYEDAYWEHQGEWNYNEAALLGSSHYDLPLVLQWFTGNIGLHHIHHLCSLIPNYRLQECFDASEDLKKLPKLSFRESLESPQMKLWDEDNGRMVGFNALR